ncbi:MAG: V-type ATP synthase subunit A [Clostridiaceae bacterium]|jgi:V/A-type H+-transporting ATPase subunit A|nr:V-type ATP synthase subunit A [Clostridiaceae bacterium]
MGVTSQGTIYGINGPVVRVRGNHPFQMMEMVLVGNERLIGEVIRVLEDETIVQVYENTTGLKPGEPVISTGRPLTVKLGPGIIGNIFDGIERPLTSIAEKTGPFIGRGTVMENLDAEKLWDVKVLVRSGYELKPGTVIAEVRETPSVVHRVMVPPGIGGVVDEVVKDGSYPITQAIVRIRNGKVIHDLAMVQEWPVRTPRPYKRRLSMNEPLITGQRVIDSLFPIAKGGTAAIPGGFGTGKTLTQHQLAKWSNADIIVYVGCGERGNEITQVLEDFPNLIDPRNNRPLMERTVIIANTSNMPVAAREASIYTGITLAEYYRDMGYHVAVMADSTSRWAEALREISGRLEEMPAEEGFPAYLPSRLSEFYERAGMVETLNDSTGSISIIGAVSPQGGDFSEPVTQNTKRFIRCFWALDKSLAYTRHYPAINWMDSYSEYTEELKDWYIQNAAPDFMEKRERISRILQEESKLLEIVKLIGSDILPNEQKLVLESARVIRQGFLQQNAYHEQDTYVPIIKQYHMMKSVLNLHDRAAKLVAKGIPVSVIKRTGVFEEVIKAKYTTSSDDMEAFETLDSGIDSILAGIEEGYRGTERRRHA